jgi:hypothetical protein
MYDTVFSEIEKEAKKKRELIEQQEETKKALKMRSLQNYPSQKEMI